MLSLKSQKLWTGDQSLHHAESHGRTEVREEWEDGVRAEEKLRAPCGETEEDSCREVRRERQQKPQ